MYMCEYVYMSVYVCICVYVCTPRKAFRKLEAVTPAELETVPPLGGPFSHYKNRVFEDFCVKCSSH